MAELGEERLAQTRSLAWGGWRAVHRDEHGLELWACTHEHRTVELAQRCSDEAKRELQPKKITSTDPRWDW